MASKKLTAKKREKLKSEKNKSDNTNSVFLVLVIVAIIVIAAVAGFMLLGNDDTEVTDNNEKPQIVNNAPQAYADYKIIDINSSDIILDVLSNDIDQDSDSLNITDWSSPMNGTINVTNNQLTYTPNKGFTGTDKIEYTIDDGEGGTSTGTVNIVIDADNPIAFIDTSKGTITLELWQDLVPNTVDNFIKLAEDGFYEGLHFHRLSDDFMIQAGAFYPDGTPKQSPYGSIDLEIHPEARHIDGAISMARTNDPNSATSQFFICDGPQSFLDDQYAAFGVTIDGFDVLRDIADDPHDGSLEPSPGGGQPLETILINSITISYP